MTIPRLVTFIALTAAIAVAPLHAQQPAAPLDSLHALVRAELSGERAFETVAYVAPRWRLPGNTGFDESIRHVEQRLRAAGFNVETQLEARKLAKQLQYADRAGIRFAVIRGSDEAARNVVAVKDLRRGEQFEVDGEGLEDRLREALA